MIVCPECKTENPHRAKYCMNCGIQLVADSDMSENDMMQKLLIDKEKEIKVLRDALEMQQKIKDANALMRKLEELYGVSNEDPIEMENGKLRKENEKLQHRINELETEIEDLKKYEYKKPILGNNNGIGVNVDDNSNAICYEAREKIRTDWIERNSDYHEFAENIGVGKIIMKGTVTEIGGYAFCNCSELKSIRIPDTYNSIGHSAFSGCSGLVSVAIGKSVAEIGGGAFEDCGRLASVDIPASVKKIGSYAFSGCSELTLVTIPDSVTSIGSYAFSGCSGLTKITIPDSGVTIGTGAFFGCAGLTTLVIPDSLVKIGNAAFEDCKSLQEEIREKIMGINSGAF